MALPVGRSISSAGWGLVIVIAAIPAHAGHYDPPEYSGSAQGTAMEVESGWDYQQQGMASVGPQGSARIWTMAEATDPRVWGHFGNDTPSSTADASADANVSATREWIPDEGQDHQTDPPEPIAGSAGGSASATFAALCGQTQGCSASATAGAVAWASGGEGESLVDAPPLGERRACSVPTDGNPPLGLGGSLTLPGPEHPNKAVAAWDGEHEDHFGDSAGPSGVFATIDGAATVSISATCSATALAVRHSNVQHL